MSEEFYKDDCMEGMLCSSNVRKNTVLIEGNCDVRNAMYEFAMCDANQYAVRFEVIKRKAADLLGPIRSGQIRSKSRDCSSGTGRGV